MALLPASGSASTRSDLAQLSLPLVGVLSSISLASKGVSVAHCAAHSPTSRVRRLRVSTADAASRSVAGASWPNVAILFWPPGRTNSLPAADEDGSEPVLFAVLEPPPPHPAIATTIAIGRTRRTRLGPRDICARLAVCFENCKSISSRLSPLDQEP